MLSIHSTMPKGLYTEYDTENLEFCNIVYMCIKQAGSSEYSIPNNLKELVHSVISDIYTLSPELYDNDWTKYCYLTIKKMYVQPNSYGNREGFHIDGFLSDQENFIWSDCEATPTEVSIGKFELSNNHETSLAEMMVQASYNFTEQLKPFNLYDMNQNVVHRPTENLTNEAVLRTFIKVTYSKELFNCVGNAWNYKLPHIKPTVKRNQSRNHTVL
jgi:hypothetical protein